MTFRGRFGRACFLAGDAAAEGILRGFWVEQNACRFLSDRCRGTPANVYRGRSLKRIGPVGKDVNAVQQLWRNILAVMSRVWADRPA